jgi:hypothetical protein
MEPLLIVNAFQEFTDAGVGIVPVAILVPINLLVFERFHERLASAIIVSSPTPS